MLACNAGMSTSILVNKMVDIAASKGKDYKIWAMNQTQIKQYLGDFDVLLLGPQIRHSFKRINEMVGDVAKVAIIDPVAYGTANGEKVIEQAEELLK
ncbi:MAG: PTS sugar transporter subunit IIB [Erysipelotrichaceae bacterium]|nr:PTS sugar transporter subunit IIB [Erysipelotrichaceae bacterium]